MTKLSAHASDEFVKIMLIGRSGCGKTGALTSLVKAGYSLKIVDFDNGLDALVNHIKEECPEKINSVDYITFRDNYAAGPAGPIIKGAPTAYVRGVKALDQWEDKSTPSEWGKETILILDSLTAFARAAFAWSRGMAPGIKDPRQWYNTAQDSIENVLAMLTAEAFATNVIVISHIDFVQQGDGSVKGYASSIGKALGPKIPRYFNTLLLSETVGFGKTVKRKIKTMPTSMIDVKNPAPMHIAPEYDISDGLAKIFETLKK